MRATAVRAIAQLRQNAAIPALLRALKHRDIVAAEAVDGLIVLGTASVEAPVEAAQVLRSLRATE